VLSGHPAHGVGRRHCQDKRKPVSGGLIKPIHLASSNLLTPSSFSSFNGRISWRMRSA
jgi:hypothetical protein